MNKDEDADGVMGSATDQGETTMTHAPAVVAWAVGRWNAEVKDRPLANVHRRTLDDTWRQVIRQFGGDPDALIGPDHDTLLAHGVALPREGQQ